VPLFSQDEQDNEFLPSDIDSSSYNGEIDLDSTEFVNAEGLTIADTASYIPCQHLYQIWTDSLVNPYNVDLTAKTDTSYIDCRSFCIPMKNKITSDFGFRRWKFHYGIDIRVKVGDPVCAAFDGMVRISKRGRRFGNYIVLRHYNGFETVYGHLKKSMVKPNQLVKAGDIIALGGNTGHSTGPHLHLEFRYLGQPINPNDIVDFTNFSLRSDTFAICSSTFGYVLDIRKIRYHVVRKGETLSHIAKRYGVPVDDLCKLNNISRKKMLRVGQYIRYT